MYLTGNIYQLNKLYERLSADARSHSVRVSIYMQVLTEALVNSTYVLDRRYDGIPEETLIRFAREAGFYHDIGKIKVPGEILRKRGKLTPEEFAEVKKHPQYAVELLTPCMEHLPLSDQGYFESIIEVCVAHHERWDGSGYPNGLAGTQIPFFSRICSVADTYDALTSRRYYSVPRQHREAVAEICRCSGTQFDPEIVEIFASAGTQIVSLAGKKACN